MNPIRTITLSLVVAATALAPAAAIARNGADDGPDTGDDRGGQRVDSTSGSGSSGSDDSRSGDDSAGSSGGDDSASRARRAERRVRGTCTGDSTAKLKVKHRDGRLETEFEVDQNRSGVTWRVTIRRDGTVVVRTNATTSAPSGSFSVERRIADRRGSDTIRARAVSPSGEVCTARVTI